MDRLPVSRYIANSNFYDLKLWFKIFDFLKILYLNWDHWTLFLIADEIKSIIKIVTNIMITIAETRG